MRRSITTLFILVVFSCILVSCTFEEPEEINLRPQASSTECLSSVFHYEQEVFQWKGCLSVDECAFTQSEFKLSRNNEAVQYGGNAGYAVNIKKVGYFNKKADGIVRNQCNGLRREVVGLDQPPLKLACQNNLCTKQ